MKKKVKNKEFRKDTLRYDDFNQMNLLCKELSKLRKEDKMSFKRQGTIKKENSAATNRPMTGAPSAHMRNRAQQQSSKYRQTKIRK